VVTKSELKVWLTDGLQQSVERNAPVYVVAAGATMAVELDKPERRVKWFRCDPTGEVFAHHPGKGKKDLRQVRLTDPGWTTE
jgi:hypothetical protein